MRKQDDVYRTEVAKKLIKLREERGLSKKQVAEATGISYSSYRYYETSVIPPSANLIKLAEFFNVPLDYFTDREDETDFILENSADGSLPLSNYDGFQPLDEEIGDLTEQEALLISILRSADKEDKKKIVKYIKKIRDKK